MSLAMADGWPLRTVASVKDSPIGEKRNGLPSSRLSRRSAAAVRERFWIHFQAVPLGAELILDVLLLTAELGGAAIAIKLLTGVGFQWWVLPIALVVWLTLWFSRFTIAEYGIGLLGLVFFFSGLASLMYQVVWQRLLTVYYGVGPVATTLIVSTYMLGLGLGALVG